MKCKYENVENFYEIFYANQALIIKGFLISKSLFIINPKNHRNKMSNLAKKYYLQKSVFVKVETHCVPNTIFLDQILYRNYQVTLNKFVSTQK